MKSSNPFGIDNARPLWLYDLSIPLPERAASRLSFPTIISAANYLGVDRHKMMRNIGPNKRVKREADGKTYAPRDQKIVSKNLLKSN